MAKREPNRRADVLEIPANPLPPDYAGHLPRQAAVSLSPNASRKAVALLHHLQATHATVFHPKYPNQQRHVDALSHVFTYLLERVELVGQKESPCE